MSAKSSFQDRLGGIGRRAVDTQSEAWRKIKRGAPGLRMGTHNGLMGWRDHGRETRAFLARRVVEHASEARIQRFAPVMRGCQSGQQPPVVRRQRVVHQAQIAEFRVTAAGGRILQDVKSDRLIRLGLVRPIGVPALGIVDDGDHGKVAQRLVRHDEDAKILGM